MTDPMPQAMPQTPTQTTTRAPAFVRASNPLTRRLLRLGLPMGPNVLLTVRGRVSGLPRSAPVAIAEFGGRRWIIAAYGDVAWVRNLRAAGEGEIRQGRRSEPIRAAELSPADAFAFYRETLPAFVRSLPWFGRRFVGLLFRLAGPEVLDDPAAAAEGHPVFEVLGIR
jgi:deazaflavin-dependent oxidoreductase (nitroreductase family)